MQSKWYCLQQAGYSVQSKRNNSEYLNPETKSMCKFYAVKTLKVNGVTYF